jgi:hypothetical protein
MHKRTFECSIKLLSTDTSMGFSEADIAEAVSSTKEYLTTGKLSTIIPVAKQNSGRYHISANVGTYFAAHMLGITKLRCQEKLS